MLPALDRIQGLFLSQFRRLATFGAVGIVSTLVSFVVYRGGLLAGLPYPLAVTGGWAAGLLVAFGGNRRATFGRVGRLERREVLGFVSAYGLQLAYSLVGYWITLDVLGLPPTLAFVLVLVPAAGISYAAMHLLAFRPRPA